MASLISLQRQKTLFQTVIEPTLIIATRNKTHGNLPRKRRINPFIQRNTDFIKLLCVALVKYERIQTTLERAKKLEKYGNLLIELTQRSQPPPDLFTLQDGFLLRPDEIKEKFTGKRIHNRRWKKRLLLPKEMNEEEFKAQCRVEASKILLQDEKAINKLYGELADRYRGRYGGFVNITALPNQKNKQFPWLAYVEFQENDLPALPVFPEYSEGILKGRPRHYTEEELRLYDKIQNPDSL